MLAAVLAVLIICSRKHYTVDIVVAWYVNPLVFLALERNFKTKRSESDSVRWSELEGVVVERRPSGEYSRRYNGESWSVPAHGEAGSTVVQLTSQHFDGALSRLQ